MPANSKEEADRMAESKYKEFEDGVVTAHGVAEGNPDIRAGETITVANVGSQFSGPYMVTEATHRMGPTSGYETEFEATGGPRR